ncbi:uncharacterized protein EHS24_001649 [Apiotrichum porosum]|uniref:DUF7910 domain-containing protein n=1 Tax=Apiotrichum porosum TaxID=105984 RepID=A0A427XIR8_9TREE|nr:uncharacterized protein EHS24_001649 [Apiotrichum porosum]RSH78746.1 hypothetical protein EHS24_001649 [Apiotrichum porosum]
MSTEPNTEGDVIGKVTTGYQAWFTCDGDRSPIRGWWHWAPDRLNMVKKDNSGVVSWPAMHHYPKGYNTGFQPYPDGSPSQLFSNYDQATIDAHFQMMADADIDTAALQRFNPCGGEGPVRDVTTMMVHQAAEKTKRKWYCMYDVSGWGPNMQQEIKNDWTSKMCEYSQTPMYARQNGKVVVCIWGFGFNDGNHEYDQETCIDVIKWFKGMGCYVIGGVPTWWRKCISDSREGFGEVYRSFDMLSPWMVGRASKIRDLDWFYHNANKGDQEECEKHGIAYQPCVMPGDLSTGCRKHGDFYWRHFYNTTRLGCAAVYVSMFDEYNEGNQIAPTAESKAQQPKDFDHPALDEDGTPCTADYYLRLTRDAGKMFKSRTPTALRVTEPWPGKGLCHARHELVLKARVNGQFVCAEGGGDKNLVANRTSPGPWERFTVEQTNQEGRIHLRSSNGKYVCADLSGGNGQPVGLLVANRDSPGPWETFDLVEVDGGVIALKASNGKYVQASNGGSGPLIAGGDDHGWWEQFDVVEE